MRSPFSPPKRRDAGNSTWPYPPSRLPGGSRYGITLIEMTVVVAIIGLMAAISFPAVTNGLDSIRLRSACDSVANFLTAAMNRAERHQVVVELVVSPKQNTLWLYSTEPGFERKLALSDGVRIEAILPEDPEDRDGPRRILMLPGGAPPRIGIQLAGRKGTRRLVRIDPVSEVPQVETVTEAR